MIRNLKSFLRDFAPGPFDTASRAKARAYGWVRFRSPTNTFTRFYHKNTWGNEDSVSGAGSDLAGTAEVREQLPELIASLGIGSVVDVPCGDYFWLSHVDLGVEQYTGGDIVRELVAANNSMFADDAHRFNTLDLLRDQLPGGDLLLCRDCLVHFSFADIEKALSNIRKSGVTYLLTTTFIDRATNRNIPTGSWRPINLQRPPFNFPAPLRIIDERCVEGNGRFADKCLALWRVADLPDPRRSGLDPSAEGHVLL